MPGMYISYTTLPRNIRTVFIEFECTKGAYMLRQSGTQFRWWQTDRVKTEEKIPKKLSQLNQNRATLVL